MKGNDNTPLMKGKLIKNKDEDKKVLCSKKRWWCYVPIAQVVIIPTKQDFSLVLLILKKKKNPVCIIVKYWKI